ncbi:MAG: hypothetical protein AAFR87_14955 [Bacteroidota bacterium]
MSNYYEFIDGKRFNASLLNNARFRVRGVGDGRISLQDAQDLWLLANDGGRITETEEETLEYLMGAFKWTEPASKWIKEQMDVKREEIKSYYKVIDGLRYDRKVLNEADRLVEGKGDGRISKEDAELLLPLFGDFGDITIVEERTLKYLQENYNWTSAAEEYFLKGFDPISKQSSVEGALTHIVRSEFGLKQMGFAYFKTEALQQMLDYENKVSLPDALQKALFNLLNTNEELSFGDMVPKYTSDPLKTFLEGGRLVLLPGDMSSEKTFPNFPSPPRGESLQQNWIFGLELFDMTDDIFWIIVPRNGEGEVYNYVGGPNFDDEWPPYIEEIFFTILVKSCDEPYPGVPVDVLAPNGKYIVGKSDAKGEFKVNGPAGNYSIYASDGWSFQSKSFEWDGQGNDQVRPVVLDC